MNALPPYMIADGLRTITIALWGVMLGQGFWTLWYAIQLRRFYHQLRRRGVAFVSVFWHLTTLILAILVMGTEISWKIIFNGIGKVGVSLWTYPNVGIYLLANLALYLVLQFERHRYITTKIKVRRLQIQEREQEGQAGLD